MTAISAVEKIKKEKEREVELRKNFISGEDFLAKELPPNQWVVDKLIPVGMTILSSAPGQFKTYLLLYLLGQIARGEMGFGHFQLEQKNVLFVNEEMGERAIQDRLKTLPKNLKGTYFYNLAGIKLEDMELLLKMCKENEIKVVFFDSLTRIHNLSENDASDVKKIYEAAKILLKEGISIIMTHHHRKAPIIGKKNGSDEMRGSTDLLAMIDCHLAIDEVAPDKSFLIMKQLKLRQAENVPDFKLGIEKRETEISFAFKGNYSKQDEALMRAENNKEIVLKIIEENPGSTREDINVALAGKLGERAIKLVLPLLESDGLIYTRTQRPKTYFITEKVDLFNQEEM